MIYIKATHNAFNMKEATTTNSKEYNIIKAFAQFKLKTRQSTKTALFYINFALKVEE